MKKISTKKIVYTAIFASLCCVATLISIPLPYGFVNAGDVFVLCSCFILGPLFGAISAGVGTCLADIILGFPIYAPVTFFVKILVVLVAYFSFLLFKKLFKGKFSIVSRVISSIIGEIIMVLGYFIFESVLYGVNGALLSVFGNCMQGLFAVVVSTILLTILLKKITKLINGNHTENL